MGPYPCTNTLIPGFKTLPFPTAWLLGSSWGSPGYCARDNKTLICLSWTVAAISNSSCLFSSWLCLIYTIISSKKTRVLTGVGTGKKEVIKPMHIKPGWICYACQHVNLGLLGETGRCSRLLSNIYVKLSPPRLHTRWASFPRCIHGTSLPLRHPSSLPEVSGAILLKMWAVN